MSRWELGWWGFGDGLEEQADRAGGQRGGQEWEGAVKVKVVMKSEMMEERKEGFGGWSLGCIGWMRMEFGRGLRTLRDNDL